MKEQIDQSIGTAIERWREVWSELINKRVKDAVALELQEVKTDICMLEATVKVKADLKDYETTNQRVDKLDKAYQSMKGEIRSVNRDLVNIKDIADRIDPANEAGAGHETSRQEVGELSELRERIRTLESSCDTEPRISSTAPVVHQIRGIVIKNVPEEASEKRDKNELLNKVNTLFRDGLKLEVGIVSVQRKISRTTYPGLLIVKLENNSQQVLVLKAKRTLRDTEQYRNVYIEPELSYEAMQQERNNRLLLKAVGRDEEFQYKNGRLIQRPDERQNQFYDRVQRQQEDWLARSSRGGPRYRQFVNRGFREGQNRRRQNREGEHNDNSQWPEQQVGTGGEQYTTPVPSTLCTSDVTKPPTERECDKHRLGQAGGES